MIKFLNITCFCVWIIKHLCDLSYGVIIPPRWANETLNPCARTSWKLLHWPEDGRCYSIFTQGPCKETEEIFYNDNVARASCRCSNDAAWHSQSQRCYNYFSKGPCNQREYFAPQEKVKNDLRPFGKCLTYKKCSPGHLFWPPSEKCFLHLSRGPCVHGSLLYENVESGSTECGCKLELMLTNYWKFSRSCHELFTKGPCIDGHIFIYNLTKDDSECACGSHMVTNYYKQTKRCYELDTIGPCRLGQLFTYNSQKKETECSCLPGYVKWLPTHNCFRVYTRGPCSPGSYLYPHNTNAEMGECIKSECFSAELYDPHTKLCYSVGKRGPCEIGKLWVFERATSIRGLCHCDPQLIGYWKLHGICYELGERGPCLKRKVLFYDKMTGLLQCKCDIRSGFVSWANGRCIKVGVQKHKLIPVAEPLEASLRGNIIPGRIQRGLTLPFQEQNQQNVSLTTNKSLSYTQEEILKDVLSKNKHSKHDNDTDFADIFRTQMRKQTNSTMITKTKSFS